MTIAKTDARKQYAGNGSTTPFSFPYRFFADSDLQVYLLVDATDVETLQTLTTHYSVSNNGDETGGTITMVTAPATGETLTILRAVPQTQGTDYAENDSFPAETHEAALDRVTLLTQQLQEELGRALIAPASDSSSVELPIDRASSFLFFDASKNPTAASGTTDTAISTAMTPVVQAATLAAGRTAFGLAVSTDVQAWNTLLDDIAGLPATDGNFIVGDGTNWVAESGATAFTSIKQAATTTATGVVEKATTAENAAGSSDSVYPTSLGVREAFNATGTAPVYACRAWVNFNGTGTVAIRASGNVSSITDNATGNYTVNFSTAIEDANYTVAVTSAGSNAYTRTGVNLASSVLAGSCVCVCASSTGAAADRDLMTFAAFR